MLDLLVNPMKKECIRYTVFTLSAVFLATGYLLGNQESPSGFAYLTTRLPNR